MKKGASVSFEWSTKGGNVNFDTHGDSSEIDYHGYGKGRQVAGDNGELVAAFDGNHGWFWRNRSGNDVTITLSARITPTGRYYGSITSTHIAMELADKVGREVERRWVEIAEPIREPGKYDVTLRFSTEVTATIHVNAEVEE